MNLNRIRYGTMQNTYNSIKESSTRIFGIQNNMSIKL